MTNRTEIERLVGDLHAARVRGDLAGMCRTFRADGQFRIAGASEGKPVSISAGNLAEFEQWLRVLVKAFRVTDYSLVSLIVDGPRAAAHWHARIQSRITNVTVATELVDLIEVSDGAIARYSEFFVPL
jgi:ketosteroid isomerase-like protein